MGRERGYTDQAIRSAPTGGAAVWGGITGTLSSQTDLNSALGGKQATLVSATNIKTVNGSSLLGAGDLTVSGTVADGDKGDITVSSSGATWTIDSGAVTLAKMADMATASLIYRKTAGTGAPEVQSLATLKTDLGLTGTNSGDQTSIVGITGTKSQFDTACTDGDFAYQSDLSNYLTTASAASTYLTTASAAATYLTTAAAASGYQPLDAQLTDLAGLSYAANALKVVRVNAGATGFELATLAGGDVVGPASATDNAIARFDSTTGKLLQNSGITISDNGEMVFPAGGSDDAPIKLTAGTNLSAAEAGAIEFDGKVFYSTPVGRGISPSTMFAIVPSGGFALSTAAGVQSCFPAATDVWTLAASTSYFFEGMYYISKSTNAVTTAMAFALGGGASVTSIAYEVYSHAAAVNAAATSQSSVYVTQVASTVVTASTAANTLIKFTGIIRMNAGGTVTPQVNFSGTAAGSPTMAANSFIRFTPIGTDTVASVGSVA